MVKSFVFVIFGTSLILLVACSPPEKEAVDEKDRPIPVRITEIESRELPMVVESVGRLAANREVTVAAELGGKIISYHADVAYLAQFYELERVGTLEPKPGIEPTARHLAELSKRAKAAEVKLVIYHQAQCEKLPEKFAGLRGYELLQWMPVLAGRVVGSVVESERFLWDYRRTLGDLMAEEHYGEVTRALHERGMGRYGESHEDRRAFVGDGMQVKKSADIPMDRVSSGTPGRAMRSRNSRSARNGTRCTCGSSAAAGIVIRPRTRSLGNSRQRSSRSSASSGARPDLLASPLTLT